MLNVNIYFWNHIDCREFISQHISGQRCILRLLAPVTAKGLQAPVNLGCLSSTSCLRLVEWFYAITRPFIRSPHFERAYRGQIPFLGLIPHKARLRFLKTVLPSNLDILFQPG